MATPTRRPHPPGKTKTDLRRGRFTPGNAAAKTPAAPAAGTATTNAEQAMLFAESGDRPK